MLQVIITAIAKRTILPPRLSGSKDISLNVLGGLVTTLTIRAKASRLSIVIPAFLIFSKVKSKPHQTHKTYSFGTRSPQDGHVCISAEMIKQLL